MQQDLTDHAATAIHAGAVVVYPTDTQYALGAGISYHSAIKQIFRLKQRSEIQPIPVAVATISDMEHIAMVPAHLRSLLTNLLPGPLTALLSKQSHIADLLTAGSKKIAVRIPDNDIARSLLEKTGPLTVTSANIHTQQPPTMIADIKKLFGSEVAVYIDGGRLSGQPSTIVDFTTIPPSLIRKGPIPIQRILDMI